MSIEYTHACIYTICMHMHITICIYMFVIIYASRAERRVHQTCKGRDYRSALWGDSLCPRNVYTAQISEEKRVPSAVITQLLEGSRKPT